MQKADLILAHLGTLFREVVRAVTSEERSGWLPTGRNAKGDQVKWFDLAADRTVCAYLESRFPCSIRLLSEEGAPRDFGPGEPEYIMVLDPVDGSDNFSREIAPAGMAVALVPAGQPITIETVQFGLVGDLFSGSTWQATRGGGAFYDGRRVSTSQVTRLQEAMLSCDLNATVIRPPLTQLLSRAYGVRAFGSAALSLAMVAYGAFDAHLDVRNLLTPENFLASALVITEAGGIITDLAGQPLPPVRSLTDVYSLLAAGTPQLHAALIQALQEPPTG